MRRGVHTALVTPMRDGAVDEAALRRLVQRQVSGRVDGLVPCGTTGESPTLERDEWERVVRVTMEEAGGLPVTAGVGTNATRSTMALVEHAARLGVSAGLLVLPYYNKPTAEGLRRHVREAARPGLPLVVYHVPGRTAQRLSPELLAELCNIDGVIACKEATGDVAYGQDLLLATDRVVLSGDDFTWLPLCAVGGGGVVSVLSNVAPRLCARIWSALSRGDLAEAGRLHLGSLPVSRFLFAQTNPVPVKAMLGAMGLCSPECRLPLWEGAAPPAGLTEGLA